MTNVLKKFVEDHIDLIESNNYRKLFMLAYEDALLTSEVLDLHNMLLDAGIYDSTSLRNDLLYEVLKENFDFARKHKDDPRVCDKFLIQFLRQYLTNTFGFTERETIEFVLYNQAPLKIKLGSMRQFGQSGIFNYTITYED